MTVNQVPNPSFEAAGDTVELYRNHFPDPGATGSGRFTSYAGASGNARNDGNPGTPPWWSTSSSVRRTRWTAVASPDTGDVGILVAPQNGVALINPDEVWTIEYDLAASRGVDIDAPVLYATSGTYSIIARSSTVGSRMVPGYPEHRWVTFQGDATSLANSLRVIQQIRGKQVDDYFEIGNVEVYPGARRTVPFFSGAARPKFRRNFFPDPEATDTTAFGGSATQVTISHTGSAVRYTFMGNLAIGLGLTGYTCYPGVPYRLLVRARANKAMTGALRIGNTVGPNVALTTAWAWYDLTAVCGTGTSLQTGFLFQAGTGYSAGDWVEIDRVLIAPSGDVGEWWGPTKGTPDGMLAVYEGTPGASFLYLTDPDFSVAWTGEMNTSASILQVTRPGGEGNGIRSSRWAKSRGFSGRVHPTGTSADTFLSPGGASGGMRLGMKPGRTFTVLATAKLFAPQAYAADNRARRIVVFHRASSGAGYSTIQSEQVPNVAGEHLVRMIFDLPSNTTEAFVRLYNGAARDGGEIWWDDFLLVEGAYRSPYFDGETFGSWWQGNRDASMSEKPLPALTVWDAVKQQERWLSLELVGPGGSGDTEDPNDPGIFLPSTISGGDPGVG